MKFLPGKDWKATYFYSIQKYPTTYKVLIICFDKVGIHNLFLNNRKKDRSEERKRTRTNENERERKGNLNTVIVKIGIMQKKKKSKGGE